MSPRPLASLFLTTFEMPRHLELVTTALKRQSSRDFEVIVCDDGSGEVTRRIVEAFQRESPFSVQHVWQEHRGFRKCRILNEGLRRASGDYLIFLDGDCVPHRDYVRDHLERREPGRYLAGRRVELGPRFSSWLTPERIVDGALDGPSVKLGWSVLAGDSEHFQRTLRVRTPWLRRLLKMERVPDMKGCNYSVSRKDLEALNGFDEDYEGYGREDTDVEFRLQNLGLMIKSMKGLALQFHVWHPRRSFTPANDERLEELKRSGRVRCAKGLLQT